MSVEKKYEMLEREENGLCRIRALKDFGNVSKGDIGGYIEEEENLSQLGDCWICDNASVSGTAKIFDNAKIFGDAVICDNASVYDTARVYGDASVYGTARVYGNANIFGNAWGCGDANIFGNARVYGDAQVCGDARVCGDAWVCGDARISGNAVSTKDVVNIIGLPYDITVSDNHIQIGCEQFEFVKALKLAEKWHNTSEAFEEAKEIEQYVPMLVELIKIRMKNGESK